MARADLRACASVAVCATIVALAGVAPSACMSRPVVAGEPTLKTSFTSVLRASAVDKIDLLFAIDNSASMGDKQAYLEQAIPDLLTRLVAPSCVDAKDATKILGPSHDDGVCDSGQVEFPPVHDLHIGIVSSSLGPRLGDRPFGPSGGECMTGGHVDDRGHLLTRAKDDGHTLPDESASGFLAWFPQVKENDGKAPSAGAKAIVDRGGLEQDFQDLVAGVKQDGCGIESQLESWYRFLVQPDPYDHLDVDGPGSDAHAQWVGVDQTILAARHDFLRPDSLVAIVVLSDENDSEIDVRSLEQHGYWFMSSNFTPPRGTAACAATPDDPSCESCSIADAATDPSCAKGAYADASDWGFDINLRHVRMKEKYGVDPQFPIARYVTGLTSPRIPSRDEEYPPGARNYAGKGTCTNPLFAASLPDGSKTDPDTLCHLPAGARDPSFVFFAHIGGVPHELLHFVPGDTHASALTDADWVKILGKDPLHHDPSGIDPHMIESYRPRDGLAAPGEANTKDPIHGREWLTDEGHHKDLQVDRQYACTFPLAHARDCSAGGDTACDCSSTGLTHEQTPPVCDDTSPNMQVRAKAYPTTRELLLAKLMGEQGIVSSICPAHVTEQGSGDPLYGYRPAVAAIVDQLKQRLVGQCLPQPLDQREDGSVQCLVLATLPTPGNASACDPSRGMSAPPADVLAHFREREEADWKAAGGSQSGAPDPATLPVCAVSQLLNDDLVNGSCTGSSKPGWCYVSGAAAGGCAQSVLFTTGTPPTGSKISLQCTERSVVGDGGAR